MEKFKFKKLTNSELSKIRGGEWINIDGEWIWVEDQALDNRKALLTRHMHREEAIL